MHVQAALQAFLVQLEADGRSPHTIAQYRRHVTALATWLDANESPNIADLRPEVLARFFSADVAKHSCRGGSKKATTLNAMRTSIRCFAAHLHQSGHIAMNPARLLRRARCAPAPPKALRPDEVERLHAVLAAATGVEAERDRMLIEVLLGCGARIGSVLAIDVPDIDFAHNEIALRRTKNDRPATVVMPTAIAQKLKVFVAGRETGPLFLAHGNRISMRHSQRRITGWLSKAKILGRSTHSLRHHFAMRVYSETGDLQVTQAALGHASITSTVIYARVDRARVRAAVGG